MNGPAHRSAFWIPDPARVEPAVIDLSCQARPTVVGQVRTLLEFRLTDWKLSGSEHKDARGDLFLIAAELTANAIGATPDAVIRVRCTFAPQSGLVTFAVWDSCDGKPEAAMPSLSLETLDVTPEHFDTNGGWGLPLVEALSHVCGTSPTVPGKWVWSQIEFPCFMPSRKV